MIECQAVKTGEAFPWTSTEVPWDEAVEALCRDVGSEAMEQKYRLQHECHARDYESGYAYNPGPLAPTELPPLDPSEE